MIHVNRDLDFIPAIKKIMDKLKELENKIDLVKSNTEFLIKESGKKVK